MQAYRYKRSKNSIFTRKSDFGDEHFKNGFNKKFQKESLIVF